MTNKLPFADAQTGLHVLRALARQRSLLAALKVMHAEVGDTFQITLPLFSPAILVGPENNRQLLITDRHLFNWRTETDAVTRLLGHGLLVEDGQSHAWLRGQMDPAMQRRQALAQGEAMVHYTDLILAQWQEGETRDMLVEMRRIALVILMGVLFDVDFLPHLARLWRPILRLLQYISPGAWIIWPNMPRWGYRNALQVVDDYLFQIIAERRAAGASGDDLLSQLVRVPEMTDKLIRDQLLTLLIAGHDTSTALLAWAWYLLGSHPAAMARAQAEVLAVVGQERPSADHLPHLPYLDRIIKETLRLYPPIHVGNRLSNADVTVQGYMIPAATRVMYSIYLTHRDPKQWANPNAFQPERFERQAEQEQKRPSLAYVPFGGGPRNCIGAAFAQIEARLVLARILQQFRLTLRPQQVHAHMGATLEPRPGVLMRLQRPLPHGE